MMRQEAVVDLLRRGGTAQVGILQEVHPVAVKMGMGVDEPRVYIFALQVKGFRGLKTGGDLSGSARGDDFPAGHGKTLLHAEKGIYSIDGRIQDDQVGFFAGASGNHKENG